MSCSSCTEFPPLCDACVGRHVAWFSGMAANYGVDWGRRVRQARPGETWPGWESPRVQARARALIAGLSGDDRARAQLARTCAEYAARAYAEVPLRPGEIATKAGHRR